MEKQKEGGEARLEESSIFWYAFQGGLMWGRYSNDALTHHLTTHPTRPVEQHPPIHHTTPPPPYPTTPWIRVSPGLSASISLLPPPSHLLPISHRARVGKGKEVRETKRGGRAEQGAGDRKEGREEGKEKRVRREGKGGEEREGEWREFEGEKEKERKRRRRGGREKGRERRGGRR